MIQHDRSSVFKNEYLLDTNPPFRLIFGTVTFPNYHMTPEVRFLIVNHQRLQTLLTLTSQSLRYLFHLSVWHQSKNDFLHTQILTCSLAPPSPLSPLHSTILFHFFKQGKNLSLSLFICLYQWLSQLMLNLCGYINDRHCPWMLCFILFYIYHPQRPSILLRVALSLA